MLDDLNVLKQHDSQGYLGFLALQPAQLRHDFKLKDQINYDKPIHNVVFAGMGGSSLVAELVHTWPRLNVPFVIAKEYNLPAFVGPDTLVICSSYSGNTEETLECVRQAREKKAQVAVIAHGGKLVEDAKAHGDVLAEIPPCPQPRVGVLYGYRALAEVFVATKLSPASILPELEAATPHLESTIKNFVPEVPEAQNYAKQLAQEMLGKTPIIYGGPLTYPAAFKWKIDVNENAKNTAWCGTLPEFNHNEFIGWSSHPIEKPFAVIDLISKYEHPRVLQRFELSDRLLSGNRPKAIAIEAKGENLLEHLLYLVLLGDYATTYLGLLNGVDPSPVVLVEKLKQELGPYVAA